jgi:hypothetical protein
VGFAVATCGVALGIGGCASGDDRPEPSPGPATTGATTSAAPTKTLSAVGQCYAPAAQPPGAYRPVPCDAPDAEAKVLALKHSTTKDSSGKYQKSCYDNDDTDFVLDIGVEPVSVVLNDALPDYACMRTLRPPHATDPGGGRHPITSGDCVYPGPETTLGPMVSQSIIEFRCAELALHRPAFKVSRVVEYGSCPEGTALKFTITPVVGDGKTETACADPI